MQLLLEQDKQKRLSSGENRELEEAQAQVKQLQNELKIRMKLNQLQSTKVIIDWMHFFMNAHFLHRKLICSYIGTRINFIPSR